MTGSGRRPVRSPRCAYELAGPKVKPEESEIAERQGLAFDGLDFAPHRRAWICAVRSEIVGDDARSTIVGSRFLLTVRPSRPSSRSPL